MKGGEQSPPFLFVINTLIKLLTLIHTITMNKPFATLLSGTTLNNKETNTSTEVTPPTKKIQRGKRYEQDPYNETQNLLYSRALFGLSIYSKEDIKLMHPSKRNRIKAVHKKAQRIINLWKQEIIIELSNFLLQDLFQDSPMIEEILTNSKYNTPYDNFTCRLSFKTLKMTKPMIIDRFIEKGVLPKDFNSINRL